MMSEFRIGSRTIGRGRPCFIVAEIGINHNGDVVQAMDLVAAAARAGVDAVKFQAYTTDEFCEPDATINWSWLDGNGTRSFVEERQVDLFKRCELSADELQQTQAHAVHYGIEWFASVTSVDWGARLLDMNVPAFKVGSDDLVHHSLLRWIAATGKPLILSTGMAYEREVQAAVEVVSEGCNSLALLHCTSVYPCPPQAANLRRMASLRRFGAPVGFSDHTVGVRASVAAAAMGASIVEKHFTLNKRGCGPDHSFSADTAEMAHLVQEIRTTEVLLGASPIKPARGEWEMRQMARRVVVAATSLSSGHTLGITDVAFRRTGQASDQNVLPSHVGTIIGRRLRRTVLAGSPIRPLDLDEGT